MEKVLFEVNGVMVDGLGRVNGEAPKAKNSSDAERVAALEAELASLKAAQEIVPDTLGDDFPGKVPLSDAGITTWAQVRALSEAELKAVKGVGSATLEQIKTALA